MAPTPGLSCLLLPVLSGDISRLLTRAHRLIKPSIAQLPCCVVMSLACAAAGEQTENALSLYSYLSISLRRVVVVCTTNHLNCCKGVPIRVLADANYWRNDSFIAQQRQYNVRGYCRTSTLFFFFFVFLLIIVICFKHFTYRILDVCARLFLSNTDGLICRDSCVAPIVVACCRV